jgi:outer membrane immunogenic protein
VRTILTLVGASAFALAAPAFAQDAAYPADASAPVDAAPQVADPVDLPDDEPFTGFYVGAAGGYDIQAHESQSHLIFDRDLDGNFGDPVTTATGANAFGLPSCGGKARGNVPGLGCQSDKDGFAYYGRVGFDKQFGSLVVGVVGEFGKTEITDSVSSFSTTPASYTLTRKVDWEGAVRARAGYARNTTLFYATGGAGYARITRSFDTTNTANDFDVRGDREKFGWQAGGGIEQKIGRNISVGLEYLFHRYKDDDTRVRVTQGSAPATNPFVLAPNTNGTDIARNDDQFGWNSIRGVVNFRF